jgi:hypothetical protein
VPVHASNFGACYRRPQASGLSFQERQGEVDLESLAVILDAARQGCLSILSLLEPLRVHYFIPGVALNKSLPLTKTAGSS